ncbi:MAG: LytR C-terminal domain-containing protein [Ignavibacteria bacterium]|nr:LytR C-terminal domain-containing protein [Ignavibacteria bacterium]MCC7158728.1 LytR C-terminal domain-containing protein [Ignavibacteria bacterium]
MPKANSGEFVTKFKNYSINILIVLLAVITIYLFYNLFKRLTTPHQDIKTQVVDSTTYLTKQPSGGTLQIDVQNGCGVSGIADKFTEFLRSKGFDVVEMGNFTTQDIKTTMVIDRAGNMKNAKRVAASIGVNDKYVIQQMNKNYFLDATVVIGKDYQDLLPFKTQVETQTNP